MSVQGSEIHTAETTNTVSSGRQARSLIGWMEESEAALCLVGRRRDVPITLAHTTRVAQAREAVRLRSRGVDQSSVLAAVPPELSSHVVALRANAVASQFFAEGFRVAMADLRYLCAAQPLVFVEDAEQRVAAVDVTDPSTLAELTLPLTPPAPQNAQFDETRQAWLFSSRNPNLRVAGSFSAEVQPGVTGFGFVVARSPSFMQVAVYQGRHLLRDGYHRAIGLLRAGVPVVPVFMKSFASVAELGLPPGMLRQEEYLGDRPPLLTDYDNDEVAADVQAPPTDKIVALQALEYTPLLEGGV